MDRAEVIYCSRVDVKAAADIERRHVGPYSHDVLQAQVRQLSAIPEEEPFYSRTPTQQDLDGRVSDVETCREVNALATTEKVKSARCVEKKAQRRGERGGKMTRRLLTLLLLYICFAIRIQVHF